MNGKLGLGYLGGGHNLTHYRIESGPKMALGEVLTLSPNPIPSGSIQGYSTTSLHFNLSPRHTIFSSQECPLIRLENWFFFKLHL